MIYHIKRGSAADLFGIDPYPPPRVALAPTSVLLFLRKRRGTRTVAATEVWTTQQDPRKFVFTWTPWFWCTGRHGAGPAARQSIVLDHPEQAVAAAANQKASKHQGVLV